MSGAPDLTGFWSGDHWYDVAGGPRVPFLANLDDRAGAVSGSISEPNGITDLSDRLTAFVRGRRDGREVAFARVYDGASDAAHRVDYVGVVTDDGAVIAGRWMLAGATGGFTMIHPAADEDAAGAVEETAGVTHHDG